MSLRYIVMHWIRSARLPLLYLTGLLLVFSCSGEPKGHYISLSGSAQGTSYHITYESPDSTNYQPKIEQLLREFDLSLSTYQPNSIISKVNSNVPGVELDDYFRKVFRAAREVYEQSDGAFDITIAPVVNAWGFGFTEAMEVDSMLIDSLLEYVGMDMVRIEDDRLIKDRKEIMLDVNAIAQGYAVDVVAAFFDGEGLANYLVEIGGEVRTKGVNAKGIDWRIGIDKPIEGLQIAGVQMQAIVSLSDHSLATSGNYRRFYEKDGVKYAHTIDPATGYPVRHGLLSATVLTSQCMIADAWATAFMVMGVEQAIKTLEEHEDLEGYLIYNDESGTYRTFATRNFKRRIN